MNPLVSIIIASYNKVNFISETIQSVLNQSFLLWELIIVDDNSSDKTVSVIENYLSDERIRLLKNNTNCGANYCRNSGLKFATGKYIIFLDADDLLHPNCLTQRIKTAELYPSYNLLVFSMGVFFSRLGDAKQKWEPNSKQPLQDFLQHKLPWSILQPFWDKQFLLDLNGFDEGFLRLQDVELNTRALFAPNIKYKLFMQDVDCFYRIDETRKNYNVFDFLSRWIDSSVKYYHKFYLQAKQIKKENYLLGTIYETYLPLIYHYKKQQLSNKEFKILEYKLLFENKLNGLNLYKQKIIKMAFLYNYFSFRVPGINRLFKLMLTR